MFSCTSGFLAWEREVQRREKSKLCQTISKDEVWYPQLRHITDSLSLYIYIYIYIACHRSIMSNIFSPSISATCSRVCCCSNLFYLSVLSPPLSVFHLLQVSVCLIWMPSSESSCVLDRCYQDRVNICTHIHTQTHHSLSCGASCPDCVNPRCPPHISLHPSTSTPLWWRHTHTRMHAYYSPSLSLFQLEKSQRFCL